MLKALGWSKQYMVESLSGQAEFVSTCYNFLPLVRLPLLHAYMSVLTAVIAGALYPWDNLGKAVKFQACVVQS